MLVPFSWLKEFVDLPKTATARDVAEAITRRGLEVEGVIELGKDLVGPLVVARVLSIEELTEFKKPIRFVMVDAGEKSERGIVCGASNFSVGDLVVVAMPGAILPGNFAIAARETYGKTSNGMICSARELGISDEHSGIMVLAEGAPGDDAEELLGIRDSVIDVAVTPDRGYALSMRGIAREVAIAFDLPFTDPTSRVVALPLGDGPRAVAIDQEDLADRIVLRTVEGFDSSARTPLWMQRRLEQCGMRSISLLVDITNYVMLELGQPLHAFDDQALAGTLRVRAAKKGEKLETLDHVKRTLDAEDAVIADDSQPLAIAGVMGGLSSEIGLGSTRTTIEAAHFNPMKIAKTSRRHRLSSEASRRFERGVDHDLAPIASARAIELLIEIAGGRYVGGNEVDRRDKAASITFDFSLPSRLVGMDYSSKVVKTRLEQIGCTVREGQVVAPSWRPDLTMPEDLVEEVARLEGYEHIPSVLPQAPGTLGLSQKQITRRRVGMILASRGGVEVLSYPFVGQGFYDQSGISSERIVALANPISEEEPYMRTTLLSGLFAAVTRNTARGARNFSLFEIGSVFHALGKVSIPRLGVDRRPTEQELEKLNSAIPAQPLHVAGIFVGEYLASGWWGKGTPSSWRVALAEAQSLLSGLATQVRQGGLAPFHPGRCAEILVDGEVVGHAGEIHPRVCAAFGLPDRTSAFEINLDSVGLERVVATPVNTMVPAIEDIALVVDPTVSAESLRAKIVEAHELIESVTLFDRYAGEKLGGKVSLAFTLTMRAADRTLTADDLAEVRQSVLASVAPLGAQLRG